LFLIFLKEKFSQDYNKYAEALRVITVRRDTCLQHGLCSYTTSPAKYSERELRNLIKIFKRFASLETISLIVSFFFLIKLFHEIFYKIFNFISLIY